MSCDTAKENASVVDSSVTDWKHDMGNSDELESSSYKGNGEGYASNENASHMERNQLVRKTDRLYNTRYFIIKSLNHHNLQLSVDEGIWATQVMNEPILEEAFHNSGRVILIFSVNMSGFFQGYAQMVSSIGLRHDHIWSQGRGKGGGSWGRSFKVKWLQLNDLPFQRTLHLKNPLNEYKPVKISRDCQELPEDIGEALCRLIDGENDVGSSFESFGGDDFHLKATFTESPYISDVENNGHQIHVPWGRTPVPYPPFLYHHPAGASSFHLANPESTSNDVPENRQLDCGKSKAARKANIHFNGNLINPLLQHGGPSQPDFWGVTTESPHASTLTDDDFLDMTYEQYLEVHSRSINLNSLAAGKSQATGGTSRSTRSKDDQNSSDGNHPRTAHEGSISKSSRDEGRTSMTHETSRSKQQQHDYDSNSSDRSHRQTKHETSRRKRLDDDDINSSGHTHSHKRRHRPHDK